MYRYRITDALFINFVFRYARASSLRDRFGGHDIKITHIKSKTGRDVSVHKLRKQLIT